MFGAQAGDTLPMWEACCPRSRPLLVQAPAADAALTCHAKALPMRSKEGSCARLLAGLLLGLQLPGQVHEGENDDRELHGI